MSLFPILIFLAGIALTYWGFKITFSKKFFNWMEENLWKDKVEIMSKKEGFVYNKVRGVGMLIAGILALIISSIILFEQF